MIRHCREIEGAIDLDLPLANTILIKRLYQQRLALGKAIGVCRRRTGILGAGIE